MDITFNSVDLYNEEIKITYLNKITDNKNSKITIRALLAKATPFEIMYKRDLYTFSIEEIRSVIVHSNPMDKRSAERTFSVLYAYIHWALRNGYYITNIHPMDGFRDDWVHQFVTKKKLFISEKELTALEDSLENYQDKVALRLIFEGVLGDDHSEILNLKRRDIDFDTGTVTVHDIKMGTRDVNITDRALSFVKGALNESSYKKWSLTEGAGPMIAEYEPLVESDYVIRGLRRKKNVNEDKPQGYQVVYQRIKKIGEQNDLDYLTSSRLQRSGMLAMAAKLIRERGKFGVKERNEVAQTYNLPKIFVGNSLRYNGITFNFVNAENLKELYDITVDKKMVMK